MTEQKIQAALRPPASGRKLEDAITHALEAMGGLPESQVKRNGKWQQGPLFWRLMLEMSLDAAAMGLAPAIRKNDLAYQLKQTYGKRIEVDHKLWSRFQNFHQKYRKLFHLTALELNLPPLTVERITNSGAGGDPDKTEAVFWLSFDTDRKPASRAAIIEPSVVDQASSTPTAQPDFVDQPTTACPVGPQDQAQIDSEFPHPEFQQPTPEILNERASSDAPLNESHTAQQLGPVSDACLLLLSTLRSQSTPAVATAVVIAATMVLTIPFVGGVLTDIAAPAHALADSIAALASVINGLIVIRT
jgi:hypothetical protein